MSNKKEQIKKEYAKLIESKFVKLAKDNEQDYFLHQKLIFNDEDLEKPVYIFGLGFIGSNIALNLVKTGFRKINLIDFDFVERRNILSQLYNEDQIGLSKAYSLAENLNNFTISDNNTLILPYNTKLEDFIKEGNNFNNSVIILAVDTIKARQNFLNYYKNNLNKFLGSQIIITGASDSGFSIHTFLQKNGKKNNINIDDNKVKSMIKKYVINKGLDKNELSIIIEKLNVIYQDKIRYIFDLFLSAKESDGTEGICNANASYFIGSWIAGLVVEEIRKANGIIKIDGIENYSNIIIEKIKYGTLNEEIQKVIDLYY